MNRVMLFFAAVMFCQDPGTITDDSEVETLVDELQQAEVMEMISNPVHQRLRYHPDGVSSQWHYRSWITLGSWQAAARVDRRADDETVRLAKLAVTGELWGNRIHSGHIRCQAGQGVMWGSAFGRRMSAGSITAISRTGSGIRPDMSTRSARDLTGVTMGRDSGSFHWQGILAKGKRSVKFRSWDLEKERSTVESSSVNRRIVGLILEPTSGKQSMGISWMAERAGTIVGGRRWRNWLTVYHRLELPRLVLTGESVIQGKSFGVAHNLIQPLGALKWMVHYHRYSVLYQPISGSPMSRLGKGNNEEAWLMAVQTRIAVVGVTAWAAQYRQLAGSDGKPPGRQAEWCTRLRLYLGNGSKIELQLRERSWQGAQAIVLDGIDWEYWAQITGFSVGAQYESRRKYPWVLQCIWHIRTPEISDREGGMIISMRFPTLEPGVFQFKYGFHMYRTDSWDSRLYGYEPGLPGEFRILPFYGTGASAYFLVKAKLDKGSSLWIRYQSGWSSDRETNPDYELTLQYEYNV